MNSAEVKSKVDAAVTKIFGTSIFNDSTSIQKDIGGDSLDFVEFIMELEGEFGIAITEEEAEKLANRGLVKDIYYFIQTKLMSLGRFDGDGEEEGDGE